MSLTDVMSGLKLVSFAQIALVIFFAVFVAIVVWVMLRPKREIERAARLPLERDDAALMSNGGARGARPEGDGAARRWELRAGAEASGIGEQGSGR
ncbi:MAG: cbb3-type cytochrome oxidase subunit 3 [Phycisphaerae bacterium]